MYCVHKLKSNTSYGKHKDVFSYREDGKRRWLQRLCFFILKKLECFHPFKEITYEPIKIEVDTIRDYIMEQKLAVMEEASHYGDSLVVLIGQSEFIDFTSDLGTHGFDSGFEYGRNGEKFWMGMKIITLPYWEGVLVVPSKLLK